MKCVKCGGTNFKKDGTAKYPPASDKPYGAKQRFTCKGCGKRAVGGWVFFDKQLYDQFQRRQFRKFLDSRKAYEEAKTNQGWGGFRVSDL